MMPVMQWILLSAIVSIATILPTQVLGQEEDRGLDSGDQSPGFPAFGPPPGFGPPGVGRGFGPPGLPGMNGTAIQLLEMKEVTKELKVTNEQVKELEEWLSASRGEMFEIMRSMDFPGMMQMEDADRKNAFSAMREKMDRLKEVTEGKLVLILTPEQQKRLAELQLQRQGVEALLQQKTKERLELSSEQIAALEKILPDQSMPPMFNPFGNPIQNSVTLQEQSFAILDNRQKSKWAAMQGIKFLFPQLRGFQGDPGGPGGMMGQVREIVAKFDLDGNERLEKEERADAREFLKSQPKPGPFGRDTRGGGPGRGRPGGMFGNPEPIKAGPKVDVGDVPSYPNEPLYSDKIIRTLFLEFDDSDWEQAMADFYRTDVEIPATLIVDGVKYPEVGVHFRGMSSFGMVREGQKRSLNVTIDYADSDQRLYGHKTLNLLNSHEDPSFLHTVLYLEAARKYIPAPKANFVHVVINGESWGLYTNAEQFNKDFVESNFGTSSGSRWKASGSPMGRGGLEYLGENIADYKRIFSIKSKDSEKAWKSLISLCRVLNETKTAELPNEIEKILDVEGVLKFLALEVALINSDGYWIRASDYSLYRDTDDIFHIIIHDANETFSPPMGPPMGPPIGMGPGLGGLAGREPGRDAPAGGKVQGLQSRLNAGVELDPLVGLTDQGKPLRSKLLAVPRYRVRYLEIVKQINNEVLDWEALKPRVEHYVSLVEPFIKSDTRKLSSYEAFRKAVNTDEIEIERGNHEKKTQGPRFGREEMSLQEFVKQRHSFLAKKLESAGD